MDFLDYHSFPRKVDYKLFILSCEKKDSKSVYKKFLLTEMHINSRLKPLNQEVCQFSWESFLRYNQGKNRRWINFLLLE